MNYQLHKASFRKEHLLLLFLLTLKSFRSVSCIMKGGMYMPKPLSCHDFSVSIVAPLCTDYCFPLVALVFTSVSFSCLLLRLPLKKFCSFHWWHLMFWVGVTPSSEKNELLFPLNDSALLLQYKTSHHWWLMRFLVEVAESGSFLLLQKRSPGKGVPWSSEL